MPGWTVIKTFSSRMDAELAKTLLTSCGIQSIIEADDTGGMYPQLDLSNGIRLKVIQDKADEALKLLLSPDEHHQ